MRSCLYGFFFRGGVTIGDLFHDGHIVFGPALNQAYDLESKKAVYPRAILDPDLPEFISMSSDFLCTEGEKTFLDPFTYSFIVRRLQNNPDPQPLMEPWAKQTGLKTPIVFGATAKRILLDIFSNILFEREKAPKEIKAKYDWLYERIGRRIGVL